MHYIRNIYDVFYLFIICILICGFLAICIVCYNEHKRRIHPTEEDIDIPPDGYHL